MDYGCREKDGVSHRLGALMCRNWVLLSTRFVAACCASASSSSSSSSHLLVSLPRDRPQPRTASHFIYFEPWSVGTKLEEPALCHFYAVLLEEDDFSYTHDYIGILRSRTHIIGLASDVALLRKGVAECNSTRTCDQVLSLSAEGGIASLRRSKGYITWLAMTLRFVECPRKTCVIQTIAQQSRLSVPAVNALPVVRTIHSQGASPRSLPSANGVYSSCNNTLHRDEQCSKYSFRVFKGPYMQTCEQYVYKARLLQETHTARYYVHVHLPF